MSNETGKGLIRVTDMNAKVVYLKEQTILKGVNQFDIDIEMLSPGIYSIEMLQGNFRQTVKMVK